MTVIVGPYIEPDDQLTARAPARNLKDHLLGFLATNNRHGWKKEAIEQQVVNFKPGTIGDRLMGLSKLEKVDLKYLDRHARMIQGICKTRLGRKCEYDFAMDLVVACLGYPHLAEAVRVSRGGIRPLKNRMLDVGETQPDFDNPVEQNTFLPERRIN